MIKFQNFIPKSDAILHIGIGVLFCMGVARGIAALPAPGVGRVGVAVAVGLLSTAGGSKEGIGEDSLSILAGELPPQLEDKSVLAV